MKELPEFVDELRKWGNGEGEEKGEEGHSAQQLPRAIEGRLIIQRRRVPEAEEDDEDQQEEPSWIVEDGDEGHDCNGHEEDRPALPSKKGIGNVASIKLSDRKEVKGGDEKANPSRISDGMEENVMSFRDRTQNQTLDEKEEERVSQPDRPLLHLRRGYDC